MILFNREMAKSFDEYLIGEIGYSLDLLVEQAGMSVASEVEKFLKLNNNNLLYTGVDIFAGKGNNGLDAYACARILSAGKYKVRIWETCEKDISNEKVAIQKQLCLKAKIPIKNANGYLSGPNQIIIDGIFGVSLNLERGIADYYRDVFKKINESSQMGSFVFSIDIPSGIDTDTGKACDGAIKADKTITFICPKPGIISFPGREYAGEIAVDSIHIPETVVENYCEIKQQNIKHFMTEINFASKNIMSRKKDSHKGLYGKVGIFGGSKGMAGAVCISAMSAVKSGAGLVFMTVPKEIYPDCLKVIPEALISSEYNEIFKNPDVIAIGPGLDESDIEAEKIIRLAIEKFPKLILDAGAINIISKNLQAYLNLFEKRKVKGLPPAILTPHPGEMKRLLEGEIIENRIKTVKFAAEKFKSIVVYKGAGTIISDPCGTLYINTTGNSALARGGSGDVLTGVIASAYAANESGLKACSLAVYIHGLCGDITANENTEISSSVDEIMRNLPRAYKMILEGKWDSKICKITY